METISQTLPKGALCADKLKLFFINHLNRIYCAKAHLQERLPEIRSHAHFTDLNHAITETLADVEKQVSRIDEIYSLMDLQHNFENCKGVTGLIEDAFSAIDQERHDPEMCDLSILFYLQQIESIEMTSFKMLNLATPVMDKKEIRQLLKENYDEAREDLALLRLITAEYFKR